MGGGGIERFVSPVVLVVFRFILVLTYCLQILPWDSDVDVQVAEESMQFLASYYNMTVFHYRTPRIPEGRDYMLEVNPHYKIRDQSDRLNVIDARWVDTDSGLFIDITTVRKNYTHPAGPGVLSCKDGHEYRVSRPQRSWGKYRDQFFSGELPFPTARYVLRRPGGKDPVCLFGGVDC